MSASLSVMNWSTNDVQPQQRLDYYADALSSSIVPLQLERPPSTEFAAHLELMELGGLSFLRQQGSAHRCYTDSGDLARSTAHHFHLILNSRTDWTIDHRGRSRVARGEAIFVDSQYVVDIASPSDYDYKHIKFAESWVRQWLPSPSALAGFKVRSTAGWGQALNAYASALTPQFLASSPLPLSMLVDHLGALLALTAQELSSPQPEPRKISPGPIERIKDVMQQQCCSPSLTAADIAACVNMPLRSFHRCFTRVGTTFGATLTTMRYTQALAMLRSALCKRLTMVEIATRAGFCDASHLSSVVRARSGLTPTQIRRAALRDVVLQEDLAC
ncbi:helix-turn-helix domain-containing protein [Duganella sp. FT135W]|uniref:Helix-turn-helix domain-containing protein n=1 Tax=Duganella flavida TaxID=2692175 RepID=A0A6L8K6R3_9BURK|nr:AraC family transcriptional regulator [Duganella flavida]MYM22655.1 helix-turn-helix domain-containing protein [Duganella flavida]